MIILSVNTCSPVLYAVNEMSALKYIDVSVVSDDNDVVKPVNALCDSGAEICVIKSAVLKDLSPNVVGKIQLRPFCGDAIKTELVRLTVSPVNSDALESDGSIDVWCAAVPDLYDDLILTADVISRLSQCDVKAVGATCEYA